MLIWWNNKLHSSFNKYLTQEEKYMPAYKDKERNTWYVKFNVTDHTGKRYQKLKRGFATKREALDYERNFNPPKGENITFAQLYEIYMDDISNRLKHSTLQSKIHIFKNHLLPYFGNRKIFDITPNDIRTWQNSYLDKGYAPTYLSTIHNHLSSILHFAVRFHNLPSNPCIMAGNMGSTSADEMQYWTYEEFQKFIAVFSDKPKAKLAFNILYWTGMREGELLALTYNDLDYTAKEININKTYYRYKQQDYVTSPKTPKSVRRVPIPDFLCSDIQAYISETNPDALSDRVFCNTRDFLSYELRRGCRQAGVKQIRIHDFRHSHVSLLINMGFTPVIIAQRVGHTNASTTLDVYSHMFPHQQDDLVAALEKLK